MSKPTCPTKILVVDDSLTIRMTVAQFLEDEHTTVVQAENGEQGLKLLESEKPDCLLLDYEMPDINGIEFLSRIQAGRDAPSVAIVMLTGTGSESIAVQAMKHGAQDYLIKRDMTPEALRHAVDVAISNVAAERERARRNAQMMQASQHLAEVNVQLAQMGRMDPLTNLFNRRAFEESLKLEHERSVRHGHPYGIIMMDIDHFKLFNDSQGHQAGDGCLQQVSRCIAESVRAIDMVGRYGGEEFIVLLPETDLEGARVLAERIRSAVFDLGIPHPASKTADQVTVSIGVAVGPVDRWENLIKQADEALYAAKETGRNKVCTQQDLAQKTKVHQKG